MDYDEFLVRRQKLIANVIKAGFEKPSTGKGLRFTRGSRKGASVAELVEQGEGPSSLCWVRWCNVIDLTRPRVITWSVVKTIAAFLNTGGGTLAIGADDGGRVSGSARDLAVKN